MKALLLNLWDRIQGWSGWDRIQAEPVLATTLVGAVLGLLVVFGVPISDEQKTAVVVVVTAVLALFARSQVTPTAAPVLPSGTSVSVTTPVGMPDYQKVV